MKMCSYEVDLVICLYGDVRTSSCMMIVKEIIFVKETWFTSQRRRLFG